MRHGWVYIYESPLASARCEELLDHFALDGISLAEPVTGRVARLSPMGEQISSSREDIVKECASSLPVQFNLYLGPSDNLFTQIVKVNDNVLCEGYSLDGKTEEQALFVIESLIRLFSRRAARRVAFGLVADRYAELHRDFHWNDFFVGKTNSPPEWPLVMGFSNGFAKLSVIPDGCYSRAAAGENGVLFRKGGSL